MAQIHLAEFGESGHARRSVEKSGSRLESHSCAIGLAEPRPPTYFRARRMRETALSLCLRRFGELLDMADKVSDEERASLQAELEHLRQEHRDLDAAIEALLHLGAADQLQVQRLKKRKLVLRDRLAFLEDQLTPDIIA